MAELTSTALITEHQPGRYAFHELTRAYAAELSDSTDTDTDRHEALARLLDHNLHSNYAAQVELKPHREPIAPSPPLPGVTPEQFSDYASAMSWFTAERNVLNASVSLAAGSDFGFPGLAAGPEDAAVLPVARSFHDWKHTMETVPRA
jgi:hypothetical protein